MKKAFQILLVIFLVASCGSKKKIITKKSKEKSNTEVVKIEPKDDENKTIPAENDKPKKAPVINSTTEYIAVYKDIAVKEMNLHGIPASITLAQGILESGSGKGRLAVEANNHFGIKCHGWQGGKIYHDDDRSQECFRKYKNAETSFKDHSEFLTGRKRYANLFKLKRSNYKGWAKELRRAGYATDKKYPQKLISIIERYELYKYDSISTLEPAASSDTHVVVKGDTLYSISKRYKISIEQLKALNKLGSNEISIGQILRLE